MKLTLRNYFSSVRVFKHHFQYNRLEKSKSTAEPSKAGCSDANGFVTRSMPELHASAV